VIEDIATEHGISDSRKSGRIVNTYDYRDEKNNLLFQVVRYEPKDFWQRRPDGKSGWINGLNGQKRVLYNLPELLKAEMILIVEGEKDADTAAGLGFCATTAPMGAGKWQLEYSECLRGKDIVLIPDNDQPGRDHMQKVARSLDGIAAQVKWIDLPDLPEKGDLTDWVEKAPDSKQAKQMLAQMIVTAPLYNPVKALTLSDVIMNDKAFIQADLPVTDCILSPWLNEQSITLISAWRGSGKTWLALSLIYAVSRGISFGPWKVVKPVPCLYLEGEMAAQDIQQRVKALNPCASDRKTSLLVYSDAYATHKGFSRTNLLSEVWRKA